MPRIELSTFHNWCDRRCERCPLGKECPVATSQLTVVEALQQAVAIAEQICEKEGIDTTDLPPPPPPGPMEMALQRAGLEWAMAYCAIMGRDVTPIIIMGKIARIANEDASDDDDLRAADTNPNVMLIERLRADALAVLEPRRASADPRALAKFDEADRALTVWLAPFSAAIPPSDRAAIEALAAAGRAPSPFSIRRLQEAG